MKMLPYRSRILIGIILLPYIEYSDQRIISALQPSINIILKCMKFLLYLRLISNNDLD